MTEYTTDQVIELVGGLDKIPPMRGLAAAWWITTSQKQLDHWARYSARRQEWYDRCQALLDRMGLDQGVMVSSFGKRTDVVGIQPTQEMRTADWRGTPGVIPEGWRIDSKKGYLLPKRRTKADRESQANKDFHAIQRVPDSGAFVEGLPEIISIDDRADGGGHWYGFDIRAGEKCLMAFCGGDPDRSSEQRKPHIAPWWERQKISVLAELRERKEAGGSQ
ncbi:hypothetical protein SEA_FLAPPER_9 [Gordonia phage Flapper]|uniref:Uncharacterized protein n=1 Tax=Gordonia phage Flapper TaxID=2079415 RepID=A0A2L1IX47_9CAUD|nr:hypothetical protein KNT82_gp09 [Gordonia phage Flapper]AVD99754.1 hypothetical protein SEA_FLAPPER_9 [Gordonia phage Flapper]